jgi:AhpD family alkylhydroperoxidase
MKNPVILLPETLASFKALGAFASGEHGVPKETLELIHVRASQINGCSVCLEMHSRRAKDPRIAVVAAWRENPTFNTAERAALALTESVTRIADREDAVPDTVWNEATKHYDEKQLSVIVLNIGLANLYNRINVATRQVAGPQHWEK